MLARTALSFLLTGLLFVAAPGVSTEPAHADELENLRKELDRLENSDPRLSSASLNIYVTLHTQAPFALDTVELLLDGKRLVRYLYTERESAALGKQGVHRIYSGNLGPGVHQLQAQFVGIGKGQRTVTGTYSEQISPRAEPTHIELVIKDSVSGKDPAFEIRKW